MFWKYSTVCTATQSLYQNVYWMNSQQLNKRLFTLSLCSLTENRGLKFHQKLKISLFVCKGMICTGGDQATKKVSYNLLWELWDNFSCFNPLCGQKEKCYERVVALLVDQCHLIAHYKLRRVQKCMLSPWAMKLNPKWHQASFFRPTTFLFLKHTRNCL